MQSPFIYHHFDDFICADNTKQLADPARWEINSRSWRYQTCSQVSYFNTAPASGSLRSPTVNLQYHLDQCAAVFGHKMFPSSHEFNHKYGADFPHAEKVTNICTYLYILIEKLICCYWGLWLY